VAAADGQTDDQLGASVVLDTDALFIGAYGDDDLGDGSGAVYALELDTVVQL